MEQDVVCGMQVDPAKAAGALTSARFRRSVTRFGCGEPTPSGPKIHPNGSSSHREVYSDGELETAI